MSGICVAQRDLYEGQAPVGQIALFYDSGIGGYHLRVTRDGAVRVDEAIPDRAVAIARFNAQVDLAWRTLLSPTQAGELTSALPTDENEIMRAMARAAMAPPRPIAEDLFG